MKYAMQSQLKRKLTVIVFKAAANKRHFSQRSDLLIMNSKLPSLLFIKWSVTADEWLVLKVNGICHRASKREREYTEVRWISVKEGKKGGQEQEVGEKKMRTDRLLFVFINLELCQEQCWMRVTVSTEYPLCYPCDHLSFHTHGQSVRKEAYYSCWQLISVSAGVLGHQ